MQIVSNLYVSKICNTKELNLSILMVLLVNKVPVMISNILITYLKITS